MPFVPHRVFFEEMALNYPIGRRMWELFRSRQGVSVRVLKPGQRVAGIPGGTPLEAYREGKRTVWVGVRKTLQFQSCKPSAHYQLPLITGCTGECEYCYLNTRLGDKPYVRIYVNLDDILEQTARYIEERKPAITFFEGAATSDPVPVEPYTGALASTVRFFAQQEFGRFRFVTKYTEIDSLLDIDHGRRTTVRFSINAEQVIKAYEHSTPSLAKRLEAATRVARAGYPLGFIVGPVILFDGWEQQYRSMFDCLGRLIEDAIQPLFFEIISHRFTARAKKIITRVFPATTLPMDEEKRRFKHGQFGYGKYVYPPEQMEAIRCFFTQAIHEFFPEAGIDYIV
ncbi:MAG: spore photoproduct lyase [Syntrophomonadaceae bacterium]|nr:spore photoproduct lyase [Syntrophomonadaceae bacterium]